MGTFTDNFMNKREEDEELKRPPRCRYTIVPGGLFRKLEKIKQDMDRFVYSKDDPTVWIKNYFQQYYNRT